MADAVPKKYNVWMLKAKLAKFTFLLCIDKIKRQKYFRAYVTYFFNINGTKVTHGKITKDNPLKVSSNMPSNGVIFSDGIESDYLEFNAGRTATIKPSEKKVYLVRG